MIPIAILLTVLAVAGTTGLVWQRRAGQAQPVSGGVTSSTVAALTNQPAVVHFSAPWCRPCDAVRRTVSGVVAELASTPHPPVDIELDIDENSSLAKELGVLSLPSTFIFDASARQCFRFSGVPAPGTLRSALAPLTTG